MVDGSDFVVEGMENGYWIGFIVFKDVIIDMCIYQEEIFGLVLCCMCVDMFEEVLELVNSNFYGNGMLIFIVSGVVVCKYQLEVMVGQVGINVFILVLLLFFFFIGWKNLFFGDLYVYGK